MDDNMSMMLLSFGFVFVMLFLFRRYMSSVELPLQKATCKVVSKRENSIYTGMTFYQFFVTVEKVHWCHEFELQILRKKDYKPLRIGDEGVVYFRGSMFVKFEKAEECK